MCWVSLDSFQRLAAAFYRHPTSYLSPKTTIPIEFSFFFHFLFLLLILTFKLLHVLHLDWNEYNTRKCLLKYRPNRTFPLFEYGMKYWLYLNVSNEWECKWHMSSINLYHWIKNLYFNLNDLAIWREHIKIIIEPVFKQMPFLVWSWSIVFKDRFLLFLVRVFSCKYKILFCDVLKHAIYNSDQTN